MGRGVDWGAVGGCGGNASCSWEEVTVVMMRRRRRVKGFYVDSGWGKNRATYIPDG